MGRRASRASLDRHKCILRENGGQIMRLAAIRARLSVRNVSELVKLGSQHCIASVGGACSVVIRVKKENKSGATATYIQIPKIQKS